MCIGTGKLIKSMLTACNQTILPELIIGSNLEREDQDRSYIDLPGNQLKLLQDATEVASSKYPGFCL